MRLSFIELDFIKLEGIQLACVYPFNYHATLLLRTAGPLAFIALLGLVAQLSFIKAGTAVEWKERQRYENRASTCFAAIFFVLFLVYPSCCTKILAQFNCDRLDDGRRWLVADYYRL